MGFRITTGMMMNSYKYNLSKSTERMDSARNTVLTQRKYDSYAEDPASAAHEWRIRRAITRNAGYITSNSEAYSRINTAWATLATVDDNLLNGDGGAFAAIKRADNDPTGGARTALGKVLDNLAKSIVYSLNGAMYGDHFLFAGNDEMNAPFSWDGNNLLYRGIPVDSGWAKMPSDVSAIPEWAQSDNLIPAATPTMAELTEKLDAGEITQDQYNYQLAWAAYYRDGLGPSDDPTVKPDWVSQYQAALKGAADGEEIDIDDYYLNVEICGMSALDQAWKAKLDSIIADNTSDDGELDTDQVVSEIDKYLEEEIGVKPDWGDPPTLPRNIPEMDEVDTNWEKAWVAYYKDGHDPADAKDTLMADGVTSFGLDINDPNTWADARKNALKEIEEHPNGPSEDDKICNAYLTLAWVDYCYDHQNYEALEAMSAEVKNMDLGMGLKEDGNEQLLQSTVFDRSIPGINVIGYGVDEDGDPKNLVSIMKRLADLYSKCGDDGTFYVVDENGERVLNDDGNPIVDTATRDEVYRLLDKFNAAHDAFNQAYSDVDTRGQYLQSNAERLVSQNVTLQEQLYDVSEIDPALAIEEFSYTYYCYSAALKIGTQLLSQSLIDYMR